MKAKLYILLATFCIFYSCSPILYHEKVLVVDFSSYADEGFYIYPVGTEIKERNYVPLSQIEIVFNAGAESEYSKNLPKDAYTIHSGWINPNGKYFLSRIVEEAKKFNADGIIDFTFKDTNWGWKATGTAVKIK